MHNSDTWNTAKGCRESWRVGPRRTKGLGVSRNKTMDDKGHEGPLRHGNAGSPEQRMVLIKVVR